VKIPFGRPIAEQYKNWSKENGKRMEWIKVAQHSPIASIFEHSNELSDSIKSGNFLSK
jgi:hypothetical protein